MTDTAPTPTPRSDTALLSTGVRMHYYEDGPQDGRPLVLLHGWPQTAWQFRLVLPRFAAAGYRVVAPDYRGAGHTSRPRLDAGVPLDPRGRAVPRGGYDKWSMAEDVHELLHTHLGLAAPALVLGHDIGSMLATAYAFRYRDDTRALVFGEAPQPGTSVFEELKGDVQMFHFTFHALLDLPEALVAGHEREYLQHFYDKLGVRPHAVDTEHYVTAFRQPGALRAGFDLYRAFEQDADDIRAALADGGKLAVPAWGPRARSARSSSTSSGWRARSPRTPAWRSSRTPATGSPRRTPTGSSTPWCASTPERCPTETVTEPR